MTSVKKKTTKKKKKKANVDLTAVPNNPRKIHAMKTKNNHQSSFHHLFVRQKEKHNQNKAKRQECLSWLSVRKANGTKQTEIFWQFRFNRFVHSSKGVINSYLSLAERNRNILLLSSTFRKECILLCLMLRFIIVDIISLFFSSDALPLSILSSAIINYLLKRPYLSDFDPARSVSKMNFRYLLPLQRRISCLFVVFIAVLGF